jgi:hemerythrin
MTSHCALHSELVDTLSKTGEKSVLSHDPCQFMDFLKKWWIDHIRNKDREFRDYALGE